MISRPMIEVSEVSAALAEREILKSISFSIEAGTVTSLLGQNGAGKSTLLRCIAGLQEHTGSVRIEGRDLTQFSRRSLAKVLAYVPQRYFISAPFRVFDFLLMSRYPYRKPLTRISDADREIVNTVLAQTELERFAGRSLQALSGGEQQRVLIAAALVQEAQLLLLDEPVGYLDPRHREEIFALLLSLKRHRNLTVLAVHHDLNAAALISDSIIALRGGELIFEGTPFDLMNREKLREVYGMDFLFVEHPTTGAQMVVPRGL